MSTSYPLELDSDLEIPRINQNVSEISGDVINSLRDAIFIIQKTIGLNPQGNRSSFVDRVNVSIDSNGRIKSSSLENIGLLTLPVLNKHIGATAGIQESKLALDYGTTYLKNLVDSMRTDLNGISSGLSSSTSMLNIHTLGRGYYHDGYHIKINVGSSVGVAGLEATTIGDAVNELSTILISGNNTIVPHINSDIPSQFKHIASEIGVDATDFISIDRTSTNVQEALDSMDASAGALGVAHIDEFHSNGILKEINSGNYYNSNRRLVDTISGASYTEGTSVIKIPNITSFAALGVEAGDILEIVQQSGIADSGTYQISAIGPLTSSNTLGNLPQLDNDELFVFHIFAESRSYGDSVVVNIYKPSAISSEYSPLACTSIGNENIVDTISIMNPRSARVTSIGFNGSILNSDGYEIAIKVGMGNSLYREIIIPGLHQERLGTGQADPVNSSSVAERINAYVSDSDLGYHFPITAFRIGNELAIAHNWVGPDYTLEIVDGYTGNYPLGFDAYGANIVDQKIYGNDNTKYSINGTSLTELSDTFDGYASITSESNTFMLWKNGLLVNPLRYGIGPGSVLHITGHPTLNTNGSYIVFSSNSTSVSLFSQEKIDSPSNPTTFNVRVSSSNITLDILESTETDMGLIQVFVDASGKTFIHQKLLYGTTLGSGVQITNVSDSFPIGDVMVLVTLDGDFIDFNIVDDTVSGETVRIHDSFIGSFKLYHPNGLDYMLFKIIPGSIPGGLEIVTVSESIPPDEAFLLATVHFDGTHSITNIVDNRLFGNISSNEIRDDFIEIFSQRPTSELHSNGIVRGFDLLDIPYYDSVTDMAALPLRGGIAYVNGVRLAIETQKVIVNVQDSEGVILNNSRRIIGINDFGSIQVLSDELGEILTDGYNADATFGKILPLYQITVNNGNIEDVIDIRKFTNNIDDKIDIIVDETNNIVGNFRSLEGALLYAGHYPNKEKLIIRIINQVYPKNPLVVPNGVSIIGNVPFGGNGKSQIVNELEHNDNFITLEGNNNLENIEILSATVGLQGSLVLVDGSNVNIERCLFRFGDTISTNNYDIGITINASNNVSILNNKIDNVYSGIICETGCNNLIIDNNNITNISGIGISNGIKIGTLLRSSNDIQITRNIIKALDVNNTDIRGIYVDIGENIETLRIDNNTITGELDNSDENRISNGIRIISESATGNKVSYLSLFNNYINNIKLRDSFVYSVYIEDVEYAILHGNTISNSIVYDSNYDNTALIWIDDSVDSIKIENNMLANSEARYGIYVKNTSTLVSIIDNTLDKIGNTNARYIYGNAHRANISNNKLIGPGHYGVYWKGERSKISTNHFSTPDPSTDYSFNYGIYVESSYIDIVNNSVMDMANENSVGISNKSTANEGMKIIGNTIEGTTMSVLINLNGNYHIVSGNRLKNDSKATADTVFINMEQNADSITITGNILEGQGTHGIYAANKVTNIAVTNNSIITTNLTGAPIRMPNVEVSGCMFVGNSLPGTSTYSTSSLQIGPAISQLSLYTNNNTIGINRGLPDAIGLSASSAAPGYDGYEAQWRMDGTRDYWTISDNIDIYTRYLYFPISNIPNGSTLTGIQVQGRNAPQAGSEYFNAEIIKRKLLESEFESEVIGTTVGSNEMNVSGYFGYAHITGGAGEISGLTEVINHNAFRYYVRITHFYVNPTNIDSIRIYGVTVRFRY